MKKITLRPLRHSDLKAVFTALVTTLVIFVLIDLFGGKKVSQVGNVVQKVFIPQNTHLSTQSYRDGKGRLHVRLVTETDPERRILYVESASGRIINVDSRPEIFHTTKIGDRVPFVTIYGRWTHLAYFNFATFKPTHTYEKDTETPRTSSSY